MDISITTMVEANSNNFLMNIEKAVLKRHIRKSFPKIVKICIIRYQDVERFRPWRGSRKIEGGRKF
jgi:hypothetical protein